MTLSISRLHVALLCLAGVGVFLKSTLAESSPARQKQALPRQETAFRVVDTPHLPNALWVSPGLICGGQPAGRSGFQALQELGVRSVISVDGIPPDVETAGEFQLRYVHLPHGYDGIAPCHSSRIAQAVVQLPGPVYIHCHHGKHRSPAAAAVAAVYQGLLSPARALTLLKQAGTSPRYQGLWDSVRRAEPHPDPQCRVIVDDLPQSVPPPPLIDAMIQLDATLHRLLQEAADGESVSAHDTLLLKEQFTELGRLEQARSRSKLFQQMLRQSVEAADQLDQAARSPAESAAGVRATALQQVRKLCVDCHQEYRDQDRTGNRLR